MTNTTPTEPNPSSDSQPNVLRIPSYYESEGDESTMDVDVDVEMDAGAGADAGAKTEAEAGAENENANPNVNEVVLRTQLQPIVPLWALDPTWPAFVFFIFSRDEYDHRDFSAMLRAQLTQRRAQQGSERKPQIAMSAMRYLGTSEVYWLPPNQKKVYVVVDEGMEIDLYFWKDWEQVPLFRFRHEVEKARETIEDFIDDIVKHF